MRHCRHCRRLLPIDNFPRDPNRSDLRIDFCHRCWHGDRANVARKATRNVAINQLIERHRDEFDELVRSSEVST